ncbi:hypothetical protein [Mycobacteroides abscessus]|uniref:hypothetical protein n=1 Tax=Mycobacteroides abscessus TaxID=36809 RepID=UPI0009A5F046|nr:hypothetical protein [Mycobacteroides abscessus]SLG17122.1 Uncharacterised protein [Mycobacteroides abscessus subsp. abscessus]
MSTIPELKVEGLHPDHASALQQALDEARELLERAQQGTQDSPDNLTEATSDNQEAGSPWGTETVVSWVSPNIKKNKKES